MIENIVIIDTETTGLTVNDRVIEIAAVLFNIKHKAILQCFSTLLPCETNPVEHINHIKAEATQCRYPFVSGKISKEDIEATWANPMAEASIFFEEKFGLDIILMEMSAHADVCVAHNAEFDKRFVATLSCGQSLLSKPWICTKKNFTWPVSLTRLRLEDICNAMRVPYVNAHRALADCLLLSQCFERIEDLEERFNRCN
jgi:DNA polymerase III epsilon subunit-like protein